MAHAWSQYAVHPAAASGGAVPERKRSTASTLPSTTGRVSRPPGSSRSRGIHGAASGAGASRPSRNRTAGIHSGTTKSSEAARTPCFTSPRATSGQTRTRQLGASSPASSCRALLAAARKRSRMRCGSVSGTTPPRSTSRGTAKRPSGSATTGASTVRARSCRVPSARLSRQYETMRSAGEWAEAGDGDVEDTWQMNGGSGCKRAEITISESCPPAQAPRRARHAEFPARHRAPCRCAAAPEMTERFATPHAAAFPGMPLRIFRADSQGATFP
jgi:hypothetical protein